jgi:adenylosuccinate synthase
VEGKKVVLHQIPSGVFHGHIQNLIGSGVVLDPVVLKKEFGKVAELGVDAARNLLVSQRTHLILPTHRALDKASETSKGLDKIGSTLKGIGPAYMDKTGRNALRVGDVLDKGFDDMYRRLRSKHRQLLDGFGFQEDISAWEEEFFDALELLRSLRIVNAEYFINEQMAAGKRILAEGAQGSMLDVDFGTFPFVTSSNTVSAGVCTGLGVSPQSIRDVLGVTKAYCTRVGSGPFPTELHDETGERLRSLGNEFGATTGRPRRCGWIDLVALRFACMVNGVTKIVMTKADVLDGFEELKVCESYLVDGVETDRVPYQMSGRHIEPVYRNLPGWMRPITEARERSQLPAATIDYVNHMERWLGAPVSHLSNGPGRDQIISM